MQAQASYSSGTPGTASESLEFLAFYLGDEEYGVDIQKVNELRRYEKVTKIANAPDFIKGVINLRGTIVPIIDMRIRFNLGVPSYNDFTVVVILNVHNRVVGVVVDSVSDVVTLSCDQIKSPPKMDSAIDSDYLIGLGMLDKRILILADIDKLMSSSDIALTEELAA